MEIQTFNPKNLTKAETKKSPTKKAKPEAKTPTQKLLKIELQRQAELIVSVYQLLSDIEQRFKSVEPGHWQLTIAEQLLMKQGFPDHNNHRIAAELATTRTINEMRRDGWTRAAVGVASTEYDDAEAAIVTATTDVEDIGSDSGELLIKHLKKQQAKLDLLRETAAEAKERRDHTRIQYDSLLRRSPKILREQVDAAIVRSEVPNLESQLHSARAAIAAVSGLASMLENYDPKKHGNNANLRPSIATACPDAVCDAPNTLDRLIDATIVRQHAEQLRKDLPALEQKERDIAAELETAKDDVNEPLHKWALAGELTVEMILE